MNHHHHTRSYPVRHRTIFERLGDSLVSDTSVRCFRFAIGGTILCSFAMSDELGRPISRFIKRKYFNTAIRSLDFSNQTGVF
jgi:hypothetical protein